MLNKLKNVLRSVVAANTQPAACPEALPQIDCGAMQNLPYVVTEGTAIGTLLIPRGKENNKWRAICS